MATQRLYLHLAWSVFQKTKQNRKFGDMKRSNFLKSLLGVFVLPKLLKANEPLKLHTTTVGELAPLKYHFDEYHNHKMPFCIYDRTLSHDLKPVIDKYCYDSNHKLTHAILFHDGKEIKILNADEDNYEDFRQKVGIVFDRIRVSPFKLGRLL